MEEESYFMRNYPDLKKYTDQGLSPLHSIVMGLCDVLKEMYHCCTKEKIKNIPPFDVIHITTKIKFFVRVLQEK